jgi:phospholipid/cholesterol/gamma-HCH transport system permease protein
MPEAQGGVLRSVLEGIGRSVIAAVEEFGYFLALAVESAYWLLVGKFAKQPVRIPAIFEQMMVVGVAAIPIVFILSFAIGVMLAIQGIHTLKAFGAESQVVLGIALSVSR